MHPSIHPATYAVPKKKRNSLSTAPQKDLKKKLLAKPSPKKGGKKQKCSQKRTISTRVESKAKTKKREKKSFFIPHHPHFSHFHLPQKKRGGDDDKRLSRQENLRLRKTPSKCTKKKKERGQEHNTFFSRAREYQA